MDRSGGSAWRAVGDGPQRAQQPPPAWVGTGASVSSVRDLCEDEVRVQVEHLPLLTTSRAPFSGWLTNGVLSHEAAVTGSA